jgi:hypothetical protein
MAEVVTKRHPIRAAFWGLLIGLGMVIWFTFAQPVIGLDSLSSVLIKWGVVILGAIVFAVVLALILPAKKPKGPPPGESSADTSTPTAAADTPDAAADSDTAAPESEPGAEPESSSDEAADAGGGETID